MNYPSNNGTVHTVEESKNGYDSGYRLFYRSIKNHDVVGFEKPFSRGEAWMCLIWEAWGDPSKPCERIINDTLFTVYYGELICSVRYLASAFGWGTKKTRIFLNQLQKCGMIEQNTANKGTKITICNFDTYQNRGHSKRQTEGKQRANRGQTEGTNRPRKNTYEHEKNTYLHPLQTFVSGLKNVSKLEQQLTESECQRLIEDYDKADIHAYLLKMENYKPLKKNNINVNLTLRNWLSRDKITKLSEKEGNKVAI